MDIDDCVALCSRLYLLVSGYKNAPWQLGALNSLERPVPYLGSAPLEAIEVSLDGVRFGLLCLSLPALGIGALDPQRITLRLRSSGEDDVVFEGPVGSIVDESSSNRTIDKVLRLPEAKKLVPPLIHAFVASASPRISRDRDAVNVDSRVAGRGSEVIDGWLADFAYRDVAIVTADLRAGATRDECRLVERRDVTEHLALKGIGTGLGHHHGFSAVLPRFGASAEPLFAIIKIKDGFEFVGPLQSTVQQNPHQALELVLARNPSRQEDAIGRSARQVHMVLMGSSAAAAPVRQSILFGPEAEPVISIVICHFGSTFWFASCLQQQTGFPVSIEVIHVCDDPAIADDMADELARQSDRLTSPTRLVFMASNQGYAAANNAGVAAARGEVIVLMNSDIWLESPIALFEAADWLTKNPADAVGFTLRFDDETIQHNGIELVRTPSFGKLFVAKHCGKGLPSSRSEMIVDEPVEVAAVTGALLAMARERFLKLKGFDESYGWADFEDVDLCLRARQAGGRIWVMPRSGLYHLEGQSMREGSVQARRAAWTLINAVRFNERWGAILDGHQTDPDTTGRDLV